MNKGNGIYLIGIVPIIGALVALILAEHLSYKIFLASVVLICTIIMICGINKNNYNKKDDNSKNDNSGKE